MSCIVKIAGNKKLAYTFLEAGFGVYVDGNPTSIREGKASLRIKIGKKRRFIQGKLQRESYVGINGVRVIDWFFTPNKPLFGAVERNEWRG